MDNMKERARRELAYCENEIERLRNKISGLDEKAGKLRAFISVWDELAPEGTEPTMSSNGNPLESGDLSQLEAAKVVLRQVGESMGASEMAKRMVASGYPYDGELSTLAGSLRGILSRSHEDDPEIIKIARGEYGLEEWFDPDHDLFTKKDETPTPDKADVGESGE